MFEDGQHDRNLQHILTETNKTLLWLTAVRVSNLGMFYFIFYLIKRKDYISCDCCWLAVCIVVGWPCVLLQLSCVYCCHLPCICCTVLCAHCCFYFRCRTAGQKSVFWRSRDRPPRHRFFLVSLCLKANAEMVSNIPSCHYMLLMQPSRLKFSSNQFHILYTCKITTPTA